MPSTVDIEPNAALVSASKPIPPDHERLAATIEHAAHYLPAQGPITVFIHHNTLHAFENYHLDEGVQRGAKLFGCQPYLSEDRYRELFREGRIGPEDLSAALLEDMDERADQLLGFMGTRYQLRLKMLKLPIRTAPLAELQWFIAETDALRRFRPDTDPEVRRRYLAETRPWALRELYAANGKNGNGGSENPHRPHPALVDLLDRFGRDRIDVWSDAQWEAFTLQALWRICRAGVHGIKPPAHKEREAGMRLRDTLLQATGDDSDLLVHDLLIRFCAAYLDQGLSPWRLPLREEGLFRTFGILYQQSGGPPDAWLSGLASELKRIERASLTPLESIHESLHLMGLKESDRNAFITATLLVLRGWGGMIRQLEIRGDRVALPVKPGSLVEFLAVRLILDRLALRWIGRERLDFTGPLHKLSDFARTRLIKHEAFSVEQRAFAVFQLAQVLGWLPADLMRLTKQEWTLLITELEAFSSLERRRVFQAAYERRYRERALTAITWHEPSRPPWAGKPPSFQVVCCLDEREESFRRHLEELAPLAETFGAAGFFNIPMYYQGAADAHFVPLCPIVIRPKHWVKEEAAETARESHGRRAKARRVVGLASHHFHRGSRSFVGGALLTAGLGALASIPLMARVLFPRLTARIRRTATRLVEPPTQTELQLERVEPEPGSTNGHVGYSLAEMVDMVERLLRDIGLTENFARLVLILGHGSQSLNNPHNSAYNCGACGGNAGGPNARAISQAANDPRVRDGLVERGIEVPPETAFVGGLHNTCDDSVMYYDLDNLPPACLEEFAELQEMIERACERNAHERCRRFVSAPLTMSFAAARRHVEARSEDLAQTRPECGHATNALCIVGRRSRTRELYLDRRAFLASYDPTLDDAEGTILTRIMQAAVPVCGGINLEYYFSYVDPAGWGCGTKLPHNITSLLGVMDGAASDLRTGLPWQMVEIHEPMRLLFIVETTPAAMLKIMERNPAIGRLCRNEWVRMAVLSPDSNQIHLFHQGQFETYQAGLGPLPRAATSADWYRGRREHLGFAEVRKTET